jgi:DNA-binding protein H-NS
MARKSVTAKRAKKSAPVARKTAARIAQRPCDLPELLRCLEDLTVAALTKVIECAQGLLEQKTEGARRSFVEEVTARAKSLGMSITDLFGRTKPEPKPNRAKRSTAKRASSAAKYRGPNPGETWTGRGRPPRWLVALEATGKKRADYAV